jgi:hypothetical protein
MADRSERANDFQESLRKALQGWQTGVWTAMPGIVQSYAPAQMTVNVQPATQGQFLQPDGSWQFVDMPLLLDCPVVFPGGGGYSLTFPVGQGDECLVVFASRCIDGWWYSGEVSRPMELRMHDLSDGFALVGVRSRPRVLAGVSATSTQLRTDDGATVLDMAPGLLTLTGNLRVTGAVMAGYNTADQVSLQTHRHNSGATNPPTPGT